MQIKNTDDINLDYLDLPLDVERDLSNHTESIRELVRKSVEGIIRIGGRLIYVKDLIGHGKFGEWLEQEFGWSERSARNYMQVANHFKTATVADLQIGSKALYLLTAPSTPETVREQLVEKSKTEQVTHDDVKAAIDTAKKSKPRKKATTQTKKPAKAKEPAKKKEPKPAENHEDFKVPKKAAKVRGKKLFTSACHYVGHVHRDLYGKQVEWGARANYHMGEIMDRFIDSKKDDLLPEFRKVVDFFCEKINDGKITDKLNPETLFKQWTNLTRTMAHEETKRLSESAKGKDKQGGLFKS